MKDLTTTPKGRGQADTKVTKGKDLRALPERWAWKTIGDVADTTSGGTPSRKYPEYFQGTIPWVKSGELGDGFISGTEEKITDDALRNSSAKLFPSGTVLVALYGATVGKVGILKIDAASNQAVCALFPRDNSFTAKYMFYWLMSQRQELINKSMGGAQPNISQGIVRSHPFPLSPLPEQKRIVARLEELLSDLEAGVAALERVRAGVKRYKASVLKAACEGKLFGDKVIGKEGLPEGWVWTTLSEITDRITKGSTPTSYGYQYQTEGINFIKTENISSDGTVQNITDFIDEETNEFLSRSKLLPYDLLFSIAGTIGRVGIVQEKDLPANTNQALAIIRFLRNKADIRYAFYYLNSPLIQKLALKSIVGVGRANLSLENVGNFRFPLPPLEEQQRIVAEVERRLESARAVESAVEAGLKRAARLRQAVLRSAFEGRLAPQNPEDEPAERLLERIKATMKQEEKMDKGQRILKEREMITDEKRQLLYDTLISAGVRLSPEQLFSQARFSEASVDEFYEELRAEIKRGRIKQRRPNENDVYLEGVTL